jgi:hypothetical protein
MEQKQALCSQQNELRRVGSGNWTTPTQKLIYATSLLSRRRRQKKSYFENGQRDKGMKDLLALFRDKPYGVYKKRIIVGIGKSEIKLAYELFRVIRLPSRLKRPSRNHSQADVLLPLMVYFHLS